MGSGTDFICIRAEPLTGGSAKAAIQGRDSRTSSSGSRQRVLLEPLPSPQKGRQNETSDTPKESQCVCSPSTLKDGGTTHTQRPAQKERLDDQAGSEGRLLHDPNPKFQQTSATLFRTKPYLPIHMPAFWPVLRSLGLYQDPEASTNPTQTAGGETCGIYRRQQGTIQVLRIYWRIWGS
uniref:Uncharacterized protein n=1 Tax=Amphimedon queenslandica TaxID=400682 RepID=A0A1X7USF1_AMPQE